MTSDNLDQTPSVQNGPDGFGPDYYEWKYFTAFTTVDDFLYGNEGPYPQPAPDHPFGQLAEVLHLPAAEWREWRTKVSLKYLKIALMQLPGAVRYALTHRRYQVISDERFDSYLGVGLYSRFLQPLSDADAEVFSIDAADRERFRKCDLTCMDVVETDPYPGMFAASTITLLERGARGAFETRRTWFPGQSAMIGKSDGAAWEYAKYFVLQGAAHRINLVTHAALHFPFDPINAISKSLLPKSHLLQRLLLPHLYLSLPVNNSVLEGRLSLISRTAWTVYSPFVAPGIVIRRLLRYGYVGDGGAYPEYRFPLHPEFPESSYGEFLKRYYDTVYAFVSKVVGRLIAARAMPGNQDWLWVVNWADHCATWVPGFPDGEAMNDPENLVLAVTAIVWGQSVSHATDHDAIHQMPNTALPFRLRVRPPGTDDRRPFTTAHLNRTFDLFKSYLTDVLFYDPHNVTFLKDVDYGFADDAELAGWNAEFREALRATETQLKADGIPVFSPLDHIPNSIQY